LNNHDLFAGILIDVQKRNLTASPRSTVLKRLMVIPAKRDAAEESYEKAVAALLAAMRKGYPLSVAAHKISRDELHQR
jgi:hypothetical protein